MNAPSRYGPHREADAPTWMPMLGPGKWPAKRLAPMPPELINQRRAINDAAAAESAETARARVAAYYGRQL